MNKIVEELIDLNAEIKELRSKKEEIKRKALEHRSTISAENQKEYRAAAEKIQEEIRAKEARRAELEALAENNNQGEGNMNNEMLHFKEGMERTELFETAEYRSAYFKTLQGKKLDAAETRAMTSATSSGGAAIPTKTMDEILGQLRDTPGILSMITLLNIPELISLPAENVVNDASWVAEGADSTPSDDSLRTISLSAYELIKTIKITAKLEKMSIPAFEKWVVETLVRKLRAACKKAVFSGTGVNQPTGLDSVTWDATNSVTAAATGITYDDLVDLEALVGEDYLDNAVWVMNRKTKAQIAKLKDDQKRPLFERAVEKGFVGNLLDRRVHLEGGVADGEIYFGDWKAGYVMNFASPIELAKSGEAGFMSGSTVYRGLALVDGKPTGVKEAMAKLKKAAASGT